MAPKVQDSNSCCHPTLKGTNMDFITDLTKLINKHSRENLSDTPDFVLAKFLDSCLRAFEQVINDRIWYRPLPETNEKIKPTAVFNATELSDPTVKLQGMNPQEEAVNILAQEILLMIKRKKLSGWVRILLETDYYPKC